MDSEKNETIEKMASFDEHKVEVNGELSHGEGSSEIVAPTKIKTDNEVGVSARQIGSSPKVAKENGDGITVEKKDELPSNSVGSSVATSPELAGSKPTPTKGYGLKKWRRIRRDLTKEGTGSADSAVILKRRLSLAEPAKARDEHKPKNDGDGEGGIGAEGSVASMELRNSGMAAHAITPPALDPELELLVVGTGFSIGADSDNSDERSSKSTAATAPRLRHEAIGFGRERNRSRNYGGRGSGHAVQQRGQRGKGGVVDASKKLRGDQVRFEKENSLSSVESDLRSTGVAFMQWGSSVSNGRKAERSENYDREHSDEAQASEEVRSGYYKENGGGEDMSQEDLDCDLLEKENSYKSENHQPQLDLDPFLESIVLLQATQEALENEIQKLGEIGKQAVSPLDDSFGHFEETGGSNSASLVAQLIELNQKIESLEHKLEEASATVKAKESKVCELEAILSSTQSLKKEIGSSDPQFLQEMCEEMEFELESLLKKKMEAEVEYLIITRTTQSLKVLAEDHIALFEEEKLLVEDQKQMMTKLTEAESKAVSLKRQAEELEATCKHLLATEEALRLQNRVFKLSICSFIQLMMLCIALGLFLMHLLPPSNGVVPT